MLASVVVLLDNMLLMEFANHAVLKIIGMVPVANDVVQIVRLVGTSPVFVPVVKMDFHLIQSLNFASVYCPDMYKTQSHLNVLFAPLANMILV